MPYGRAIASLILTAFLSPLLNAAEQWTKLKTPHFELYTTAGEKKGREAILYFEQVRSFFLEASPAKRAPEFPARIVAFRSEKEYLPYRASESALAYYSPSRNHDYIVMQDILGEHYPAAIHEYTHLIVEHTGLKLPLWLNEGWADLFSSLRPLGNKARVGEPLPGRAATLITTKWLNLDALTAVGPDSPLYNERNKAGIFYAESWALTHMLFLAPAYRPNFTKLVVALNAGQQVDAAFQATYGKHLWEIQVDLQKYLEGNRFYAVDFAIKLEKSAEAPEVSEPTAFESGMVLADLLALVHKTDQARSAYERLAQTNPGQPEVEESLGYLAWQSDDAAGARAHFAKALAAGTKNAQMCYQYAMLERSAGAGVNAAIPALQRALDLKPDYLEARLQLGLLLMNQRSYVQALGQLRQIKNVTAEQAPAFFSALAYASMQTGDTQEARKNAELAKKWAKTQQQIQQADSILRYLDARDNTAAEPARPVLRYQPREEFKVKEESSLNPANPFISKEDQMRRVEGVAQKLDCGGDTLRFFVLVDKQSLAFEIPDPTRVVIKHTGEDKHDFACGPQKPYHVIVDYALLPDKHAGTQGIVRALEF